jgi:hypothetical protein
MCEGFLGLKVGWKDGRRPSGKYFYTLDSITSGVALLIDFHKIRTEVEVGIGRGEIIMTSR